MYKVSNTQSQKLFIDGLEFPVGGYLWIHEPSSNILKAMRDSLVSFEPAYGYVDAGLPVVLGSAALKTTGLNGTVFAPSNAPYGYEKLILRVSELLNADLVVTIKRSSQIGDLPWTYSVTLPADTGQKEWTVVDGGDWNFINVMQPAGYGQDWTVTCAALGSAGTTAKIVLMLQPKGAGAPLPMQVGPI